MKYLTMIIIRGFTKFYILFRLLLSMTSSDLCTHSEWFMKHASTRLTAVASLECVITW